MTPERFAEIKEAAGKLTYEPTKKAAEELIAEIERLRNILTTVQELATDTPTKKTMEMALDRIVRLCEDALNHDEREMARHYEAMDGDV